MLAQAGLGGVRQAVVHGHAQLLFAGVEVAEAVEVGGVGFGDRQVDKALRTDLLALVEA